MSPGVDDGRVVPVPTPYTDASGRARSRELLTLGEALR